MAGRAEHDSVAVGDAAEAVRGGVGSGGDVGAEIGFDFDDAASQEAIGSLMSQDFAEEFWGYDFGRFREEPPRDRLPGFGQPGLGRHD